MKKVLSKQANVQFLYCASPITIDKTKEWGEGNMQLGPNGGFLKINENNTISHLVQPNENSTAPVGWHHNNTTSTSYDKDPIWVDDSRVIPDGEKLSLETLDGKMFYIAKGDSYVVYNGGDEPNLADGWLMTKKDLMKNYVFEEVLA